MVYPSACSEFGEINPFLYRGYYYDWETGLYYLNSRYYDPEMGRFINADDVELVLSDESSFEYCYNSPINFFDLLGYKPKDLFSSRDKAALDFAYLYYNISLYIRFEISAIIYAIKEKGKIRY